MQKPYLKISAPQPSGAIAFLGLGLFSPSLSSIKLFSMGKVSDSYLHPHQEVRHMGEGSLDPLLTHLEKRLLQRVRAQKGLNPVCYRMNVCALL